MSLSRRNLIHAAATYAAAGLLLLAGSFPVAAQSGLGAVVCVGSEEATPRTPDPDRRFGWEGVDVVYRIDLAVVYRVGVPLAARERIERALLSELGEHAETSCAWSNPGDSHVAIISYKGSMGLDPTPGPGAPRFHAYAVGYGASAEAAEKNATTGNGRFATYYDGSGYEVALREGWYSGDAGMTAGPPDLPPDDVPGVFEVFRDCLVCPQMVVVPAGTFTMGSPESEEFRNEQEGPQHSVTIGAPFAVGVFEITFAEWDACVRMGDCGYTPADYRWGRGRRPVFNVSWQDAQAYVSWLSAHTGQRYRLLSEAEWEYVARAGTVTARHWGESVSDRCRYANGAANRPRRIVILGTRRRAANGECDDGYRSTAPVGSYEPNAFGLYDVLGNVSEWTQDCWNDSHSGAPADGRARESGDCTRRVLRGGSWNINAWFLRSANRSNSTPVSRARYYGFRVARALN